MRIRLKHIIIITAFLGFWTQSFADTQRPKNPHSLSVLTADFPPFSFENEKMEHQGWGYEIVKATLDKAGLPYTIRRMPWKRALLTAQKEPYTLLYPCARSKQRKSHFYWIGEISKRSISFFKLKERKDIKVDKLSDLFEYKVGAVRAYKATKRYIAEGGQISKANSDEQVFKMLERQRVDLILNEDLVIIWSLKQLPIRTGEKRLTFSDIEKVFQYEQGNSRYFVLNINTPKDVADHLEKTYADLVKSGEIKKIAERYMSIK